MGISGFLQFIYYLYTVNTTFYRIHMGIFSKIFSSSSSGGQQPDENQKREALDKGLEKTKSSFFDKIKRFVAARDTIDEETLDELEMALISSDVGVDTTLKIIDRVKARVERDKYLGSDELDRILREEVAALLTENNSAASVDFSVERKDGAPYVIMVVGVNGAGKTTTIGKLASQFTRRGYKVVLGAADTFRAAAIDQLAVWAERADVPMIRQQMGSDPASVAFDAVSSAKAQGADVVIIDTAGRLHNKANLMAELAKLSKIIDRECPDCDRETLLVLDATTGQNGLIQARTFKETAGLTGIVLTKLDGTAKGGIVIAIARELGVPVKFAGVGEGIDDLKPFDARSYVEAII